MNTFITGLALICLCGLVSAVAFCLVPNQTAPTFQEGDKVSINGPIEGLIPVEGRFIKPVIVKSFCTLIYLSGTLDRYYFRVVFNDINPEFKSGETVSLSQTHLHALKFSINEKYKQQ